MFVSVLVEACDAGPFVPIFYFNFAAFTGDVVVEEDPFSDTAESFC